MFRIYSDNQITLAGGNTATLNFGQPISVSGTLYTTTLRVNGTSHLSSVLAQNDMSISGSSYLTSQLSVSGSSFLGTDLSVSGMIVAKGVRIGETSLVRDVVASSTLSVQGGVFQSDTLSISGVVYVQNDLSVSGTSHLQDARLRTHLSLAGSSFVSGQLSINGITYVQNALSLSGTMVSGRISVGQTSTLTDVIGSSTLSIQGGVFQAGVLSVNGVSYVQNALSLGGVSYVQNDMSVSGTSHLLDARMRSDISVAGSSYVTNQVSIAGITYVQNAVSVSGTLTTSRLTVGQTTSLVDVTGSSTLSISGITYLQNRLSVGGIAYVQNALSVTGVGYIQNDLSVSGVVYTNSIQSTTRNPSGAMDGSGVGGYVLNIGTNDGPNTINIGQAGDIINIAGSKTIVNATEVQLSVSGTVFGTQLSLSRDAFVSGNVSVVGNLNVVGAGSNMISGTTTFNNDVTLSGTNANVNATLNVRNLLNLRDTTLTTLTASNTLNYTGVSPVILIGGSISAIHGITGSGTVGNVVVLYNTLATSITLHHSSTTATVGERFLFPNQTHFVLPGYGAASFRYQNHSGNGFWVMVSSSVDAYSNLAHLRATVSVASSGSSSSFVLSAQNGELTSGIYNITDASLTAINDITMGKSGDIIILLNNRPANGTLQINHNQVPVNASTNARVYTGTGGPIILANQSSIILSYVTGAINAWYVVGGSGSGSGGVKRQITQASNPNLGNTFVGAPLYIETSSASPVYKVGDGSTIPKAEVVGVISSILDATSGLVEMSMAGEVTGIDIRTISNSVSTNAELMGKVVYLIQTTPTDPGVVSQPALNGYSPRYTITDLASTSYNTGTFVKPVGVIYTASVTGVGSGTFGMLLYHQRGTADRTTVTQVQLASTNGVTANVIQMGNFDSGKIMGNVKLSNTGFSGWPYNTNFFIETNFCKTSSGAYSVTWQTIGDNPSGFSLSVSGTTLCTVVSSPLSISGPSFLAYSMTGLTVGSQNAVAALSIPSLSDQIRFNYVNPQTSGGGIVFNSFNANLSVATPIMTLTNAGNLGIGTTDPGSKLSVIGNTMVSNTGTNNPGIAVQNADQGGILEIGIAGGTGSWSSTATAGDGIIRSSASKKLILQTGTGGGAVVINSSNNVQVNTSLFFGTNTVNLTPGGGGGSGQTIYTFPGIAAAYLCLIYDTNYNGNGSASVPSPVGWFNCCYVITTTTAIVANPTIGYNNIGLTASGLELKPFCFAGTGSATTFRIWVLRIHAF